MDVVEKPIIRYKKSREQAGLSLGQAIRLLGMERQHLADIESGVIAPTSDEIQKMAEVYGVTVAWLSLENIPLYLDQPAVDFLDTLTPDERERWLEFGASLGMYQEQPK